jgi:hypothetical protein
MLLDNMARRARGEVQVKESGGSPDPGYERALHPAPTGLVAVPEPHNRRWDALNGEERRRWSAEIARQEALAQGLPFVATADQHQRISAVMAAAGSIDAGDRRDNKKPKMRGNS